MKRAIAILLLPLFSGCVVVAGHGLLYVRVLSDEKIAALDVTTADGTRVVLGGLDAAVSPVTAGVVQAVVTGAVRALGVP